MVECLFEELVVQVRVLLHPQIKRKKGQIEKQNVQVSDTTMLP